jgi:hypothetical protein
VHSVLAIDPSITCTGWAILADFPERPELRDSGHWRPSRKEGHRLLQLAELVRFLIWEHHVSDVVIEMPDREQRMGGNGKRRNPGDLIVYGSAAGACVGATCEMTTGSRRRVWLPSVRIWKKNQSKDETRMLVRAVMGASVASHDENDAIGLGLWWITRVLPVIKGKLGKEMLPEME